MPCQFCLKCLWSVCFDLQTSFYVSLTCISTSLHLSIFFSPSSVSMPPSRKTRILYRLKQIHVLRLGLLTSVWLGIRCACAASKQCTNADLFVYMPAATGGGSGAPVALADVQQHAASERWARRSALTRVSVLCISSFTFRLATIKFPDYRSISLLGVPFDSIRCTLLHT